MSNSTNTVVHFDGKGGNLYSRLWAMSHTINATPVGCSIFKPAKFEQTITHQQLEILFDGTALAILLCLHVLIAHRIFINVFDILNIIS